MEFATALGGALLSASVQPLIERLISHELDKFAPWENIHADIKNWEKMLAEINPLLDDAEDKQTDTAVKNWLDDFRDLAYDIEDVLDEFNTEALNRKVMGDSQTSTNKLWKLKNKMKSFQFKDKMASRLKKITERLQHINERQEKTLNLRRIANGSRSNQLKESRLTTCLVDESHIYGRDVDKQAILQMLLRDEGGNNPISVIAILGMGGIGKTTLAQLVYKDSAVEDYFDIKAWVCVSDNFNVTILTRTILLQVSPKTPNLKDLDLNSLQVTLKKELSQKKFLLILDDVWEEDYNQWDRLRIPFISASSSGKIVVTTRKSSAAPIAAGASTYSVKELPDDECMSILARHALAAQSFDTHLDLKDIGQKLVKRCDGLPLAAKVLGGLLRNKRSLGEWERVLRNKLWNSPETSKSVHPILKLSYNDLPSHLKRCFVYCAIVPKDYEFDRDELVSLWMAEGFLDHPQRGTLMEDLGIEYFEDLVSRSFFQSSNSNQSSMTFNLPGLFFWPTNSTRFVMHDLISDLAQTIAKDVCYNYENKLEGDMSSSKYEKIRHASFSLLEDSQEYEVCSRMKNLRTIVGFPILRKYNMIGDSRQENCYEFSPQSRCLRVLSLTAVRGLPKSIGDLKHLRHLNLSFSPIEQLPESVSSLLNLYTLLLHGCDRLKKLPDKTRTLMNLRHLDIAQTYKLLKLPSGIGMLTNLQTLSKFIVDKGDGTTIAELKNLNNLRGSLYIRELQNVQDGKLANLKEKQGLEELVLGWTAHGRNDMSVLELLQPHQNLKRLSIWSYGGAEFPSWVSNMSQLVSLELLDCGETEVLPPLRQLRSLKELSISGLKAVETIGVDVFGNVGEPFPSLESLKIADMSEWRKWNHGDMGGEGFPNLQKLSLENCPKLIGSLPSGLRHLSELQIEKCGNLVSFPPMGLPCSLKRIIVRNCDALERFSIIYTGNGEQSLLEELSITCCASLQRFETNFRLPTSLRKLRFLTCRNLLSLPDGLMMPDDNENQPQSRLEDLDIVLCPRLDSLPIGKFPAALQTLTINGCSLELESAISEKNAALEKICIVENNTIKVFPSIDCLQSLRYLSIYSCHGLESFPETGFLSTSLQRLEMVNCKNLSLQPIRIESQFPSLRELYIEDCPKVVSLMEAGGGPGSLTKIVIENCENLRQPIAEWGLGMLSSLEKLVVRGRCPATADVVAFPDDNCCWLPTSLRILKMADFLNLESVSMGLRKLTSLQTLEIRNCPKLRSLPREALPLSLKELSISGCPLLKKHYSMEKMGLLTIDYQD